MVKYNYKKHNSCIGVTGWLIKIIKITINQNKNSPCSSLQAEMMSKSLLKRLLRLSQKPLQSLLQSLLLSKLIKGIKNSVLCQLKCFRIRNGLKMLLKQMTRF